jgi:hypothetical protein
MSERIGPTLPVPTGAPARPGTLPTAHRETLLAAHRETLLAAHPAEPGGREQPSSNQLTISRASLVASIARLATPTPR